MADQVTYIPGSEEHYRFLVDRLKVHPGEAQLIINNVRRRRREPVVTPTPSDEPTEPSETP